MMNDAKSVFQLPERPLKLRPLKHFDPVGGENRLNMVPYKGMIACTARSGSSLLSVCLERYGLRFYEYLNATAYVQSAVENDGVRNFIEMGDYLADRAVSDERFSLKIAYGDLPMLLYMNELPQRVDEWKIIFLQRKNSVRQAISMLIANKSGQWTYDMASQAEVTDKDYSFEEVVYYIDFIHSSNAKWERFFSLFGVDPMRVWYEDIVADMPNEVEALGRFFDVDVDAFPNARHHEPRLKSQTSDLNRQWEYRFREEMLQTAHRAAAGSDMAPAGKATCS